MSQVDYDAMFVQLHAVGQVLKKRNDELHRRCSELEAQIDAPPFGYYNRYVNQFLIKNAKDAVQALQSAVGVCKRIVGTGGRGGSR